MPKKKNVKVVCDPCSAKAFTQALMTGQRPKEVVMEVLWCDDS